MLQIANDITLKLKGADGEADVAVAHAGWVSTAGAMEVPARQPAIKKHWLPETTLDFRLQMETNH